MSEAASPAGSAEDESSQQPGEDPAEHLCCNRCGAVLDRDHVHGSKNRTQTSYRCPECRYGSAAVVERGTGEIGPLHGRRITRDQRRLELSPSVEVLAAFIDEHVPAGTYTVERTGDHAYRVSVPAHVENSTIQEIASRLESPSTAVDRSSEGMTVTDTRFVKPAETSVWDGPSQEPQEPQPDGGVRLQTMEGQQGPVPAAGGTVAGIGYAPNEARTKRALSEQMNIALLKKGGEYEVRKGADKCYVVDILAGTCSCPDDADVCKHLRRVDFAIRAGRVPHPDGRIH